MSGLLNSQNLLPVKTLYQNKNAVIISEAQMDSISIKYINFDVVLSKSEALKIDIQRLTKELEKETLKTSYLTSEKMNLTLIVDKFKERIDNSNKLHETEILYYKEKAKNGFNYFLYGTAAGALIVTVIMVVAN